MWGDDGGSIMDRSDVGAARDIAGSGGIIRSGGIRHIATALMPGP